MDVIRGMTGVCPQHNILFDVLTPREHLEVFASLKGVVPDRLNAEIRTLLVEVGLMEKADTPASKLSGGQKRKLSLCIAVIGDPKVVFLDEPTASMDPYSRRQVWSLLRRLRPGRIILLTTHMMDEADILADRKAIMSSGRLRCVGSSFFLKNRFGIGYHLTIVTSQPSCERDRSRIVAALRQHVPLGQQARAHGMELSYILPLNDISSFAALFEQLETDKEELGVASYGIAMTTLEEVFLRLGEEGGDDILEESVNPAQRLIERQGSVLSSNTRLERSLSRGGHTNPAEFNIQEEEGAGTTAGGAVIGVSGDVMSCSYVQREGTELHATWWQQFKVLHKVRWMNTLRSIKAVLVRIFVPAVLVAASLALAASSIPSTQEPTKYTFHSVTYNTWDVLYTNSSPSSVDALLSGLTSQGLDVARMGNYDDLLNVGVHYQAMDVHQFDTGGENMTWTAIYNDSGLHALPTLMNAVATARLRSLGADAAAAIAASVQPWRSLTGETFTFDFMSFFSVMILGVVLTIVPVGFVSEVVQDREVSDCREMLSTDNTWSRDVVAAALFHHLHAWPAPVCLRRIVLVYKSRQQERRCHSLQPSLAIYLPYIAVSIMDTVGASETARIVHIVCIIFDPMYTLIGGLYYVSKVHLSASILGIEETPSMYFEWSSNIPVTLLVSTVHLFALTLLLRVLVIRNTGGAISDAFRLGTSKRQIRLPKSCLPPGENEDEDVKEERERVARLASDTTGQYAHTPQRCELFDSDLSSEDEYVSPDMPLLAAGGSFHARVRSPNPNYGNHYPVVMVKNMQKAFSTGGLFEKGNEIKVAVRNLSLAVETGEVLGLLGPNGAGKTTTLSVITSETAPTAGTVTVGGYNVVSCMSEAYEAMGYCPQHDAIWPNITLREHLICYAAMRGVQPTQITHTTNYLMDALQIREHENKRSDVLSGGTKRKLSFAISMLGAPQVVLLDEPSTGMDPQSKRFLWDTISASFTGDRGAILTTHSMEEADALCSRVGIMVAGELRCLGTTQHLKNKYGGGYNLEVKAAWSSADPDHHDGALLNRLVMFGFQSWRSYRVLRIAVYLPHPTVRPAPPTVFRNLDEA
ncbi:PREDICTED: ATP-binding cassette sub-family A member 8-A-like [Priapulus caudatus]|uniref:ATP-binding cassette sub-family A member 8-A-like n=1 Tax=Priapulus caudatus TaxID=37621 RepID=A0ABM1FBM9_PRICU|nr:PREDICTED: ATP-binding cassette sub-family A member 8-A-like [Priapulus caudatus]